MSIKKALKWVVFWVGLALCFNMGIFTFLGKEKFMEFLGGYIIEYSLSIDNLFLFLMIFTSFGIRPEYQRRVLNYGIAGAIVLRLIFILLGISIIGMFNWMLYVFGWILIFSGIRMMFKQEKTINIRDRTVIKGLHKIIPITDGFVGQKFFTKRLINRKNTLFATPLLAILILVESTDIVFAVDSIPAVFSITTDPFIVYTSNMFAILGLRSMYFVLGGLHRRFGYVKYGVALILVFTGIKLAILMFDVSIAIELSLGIIIAILAGSIAASLTLDKKRRLSYR